MDSPWNTSGDLSTQVHAGKHPREQDMKRQPVQDKLLSSCVPVFGPQQSQGCYTPIPRKALGEEGGLLTKVILKLKPVSLLHLLPCQVTAIVIYSPLQAFNLANLITTQTTP